MVKKVFFLIPHHITEVTNIKTWRLKIYFQKQSKGSQNMWSNDSSHFRSKTPTIKGQNETYVKANHSIKN